MKCTKCDEDAIKVDDESHYCSACEKCFPPTEQTYVEKILNCSDTKAIEKEIVNCGSTIGFRVC